MKQGDSFSFVWLLVFWQRAVIFWRERKRERQRERERERKRERARAREAEKEKDLGEQERDIFENRQRCTFSPLTDTTSLQIIAEQLRRYGWCY